MYIGLHLAARCAVLLGVIAGCGKGTAPAGGVMVLDSAGVAVYRVPPSVRPMAWQMTESAMVMISDRDPSDGQPLFQVRSGRFFDDGSFVIANAGIHQVRFYSAGGELEHAVGREGAGPAEFGAIAFLEVAADSVWLYDVNLQRITVVSRQGAFGRVIRLGGMAFERPVAAIGILGDGSVLVGHRDTPSLPEPGPRTIYELLYNVSRTGATLGPMGRFFKFETYWHVEGDGLVDSGRPFAPEGLFFTHREEWFYTDGRQYRVEEYDADGDLRATYAYSDDPPRVQEGDLDAFFDRVLEGQERPNPREVRLRQVPLPERMPAYADLRVDHLGNVWARPHTGPQPRNCWHVYQKYPIGFAAICLPDRFDVLDISGGAVLGVIRGELNEEHVAVYSLQK